MTSAAKVIEDVRARVAGTRAPFTLQVGELAHALLSDAAGHRYNRDNLLPALFGAPIEAGDVTAPYGYALLDADGTTVLRGMIDP